MTVGDPAERKNKNTRESVFFYAQGAGKLLCPRRETNNFLILF